MPIYGRLLLCVFPIMTDIAYHTVRGRIDCQDITQSNIVNEYDVKS